MKFLFHVFIVLIVTTNLNAVQSNCLLCQFPNSIESDVKTKGDVCENLFKAACLDDKGSAKYSENFRKDEEERLKIIKNAWDKTALTMGYNGGIDQVINAKLKESGIELLDDPDEDAYRRLLTGFDLENFDVPNARKLYKSAEDCSKDSYQVETSYGIPASKLSDMNILKEIVRKNNEVVKKYRLSSIKYFAMDIPNFFDKVVLPHCNPHSSWNSLLKTIEIDSFCKEQPNLSDQAIELYRAEGTDEYITKAEVFVSKYILPELPLKMLNNNNDDSIELLTQKINELKIYITKHMCVNHNIAIENASRKVVGDLMEQVSKSKTTIESLIDSYYTPKRKEILNNIHNTSRADVQDLVMHIVDDKNKRGTILKEYDSLKFYWMEKPKDANYNLNGKLGFLNTKQMISIEKVKMIFSDPYLSYFNDSNAFYLPFEIMGKAKTDEHIEITPAILLLMDKNPYNVLSVVAHEIGHKIGPELSKLNGYDLTSNFQKLINCYSDKHSIYLKDHQQDEAIADYISSEVLARQIQKLPEGQRKHAILKSMEYLCDSDAINTHHHNLSCNGNHPKDSLRVAGIYGANPSIRKILNCEKDSSKFKTCGFDKTILDINETNKEQSDSSYSATPEKVGIK